MRACAYKCGHVHANANTCGQMCACVFTWGREKSSSILSFLSRAKSPLIKCVGCEKKNRLTRKRRLKNSYEIVVKLLRNCYELVVHHFLIYLLIFLCRRFIVNPILFHHSIFIDCFYVHFPHHLFCFCLSCFFSFSKMKLNFIPRRQQKLLWHKWTLNKLGFKGNF